jgi:hypothetical protein
MQALVRVVLFSYREWVGTLVVLIETKVMRR